MEPDAVRDNESLGMRGRIRIRDLRSRSWDNAENAEHGSKQDGVTAKTHTNLLGAPDILHPPKGLGSHLAAPPTTIAGVENFSVAVRIFPHGQALRRLRACRKCGNIARPA